MAEPVAFAEGINIHTLEGRSLEDLSQESADLTATDVDSPTMANQLPIHMPTTADHMQIALGNAADTLNGTIWEDDNDVKECRSCGSRFTLFKRKHHCRKCGKIFCSQCCGRYCTYIPGSVVVESVTYGGNRLIRDSYKFYEFRTCSSCFEEIRMLKIALGMSLDNLEEESDEENNIATRDTEAEGYVHQNNELNIDSTADSVNSIVKQTQPREITTELDNATVDDLNECPVCGKNLNRSTEDEREEHISTCVRDQGFGSPHDGNFVGKRNQNRMLVYTLTKEPEDMEECVICLEDFHQGEKVARLECLCYFHNKCLKDWIQKKGYCECPVHSLTNG